MKTEEVMTILEENKITNVQPKHKCKGHLCEKDATIEDPKGYFTVMNAMVCLAIHEKSIGQTLMQKDILIDIS